MPADNRVLHGELLPPESRSVRMPSGTPFGLGILGVARFGAIRRVIDQYERALRAKEAAILAEAAVAAAIAHREVGREQLRNLDRLRQEETDRIEHVIAVNGLRRDLERMELEDKIAERKARRAEPKQAPAAPKGTTPDAFAAFMDDLGKLPEIVKAVEAVKGQIVRQAGGEGQLSEAQQQVCETLDTMLQSFMSNRAGEAAL